MYVLYASWVKGSMSVRVPKAVIFDVSEFELMSTNLSTCSVWFVEVYSRPTNIVVVDD
jgi:hypothetical protein